VHAGGALHGSQNWGPLTAPAVTGALMDTTLAFFLGALAGAASVTFIYSALVFVSNWIQRNWG